MSVPSDMERQIEQLFIAHSTKGAFLLDLPPMDTMCTMSDLISLRMVSMNMPNFNEFIVNATTWRNAQFGGFFSEFLATEERTRRWFQNAIEDNPNRLLFLAENQHKLVFGHLGLRYDEMEKAFEMEHILRGEDISKGGMTMAVSALCSWSFHNFPITHVFLRVFADNSRAIALYKRCGFEESAHWEVFRHQEESGDIVWKSE